MHTDSYLQFVSVVYFYKRFTIFTKEAIINYGKIWLGMDGINSTEPTIPSDPILSSSLLSGMSQEPLNPHLIKFHSFFYGIIASLFEFPHHLFHLNHSLFLSPHVLSRNPGIIRKQLLLNIFTPQISVLSLFHSSLPADALSGVDFHSVIIDTFLLDLNDVPYLIGCRKKMFNKSVKLDIPLSMLSQTFIHYLFHPSRHSVFIFVHTFSILFASLYSSPLWWLTKL